VWLQARQGGKDVGDTLEGLGSLGKDLEFNFKGGGNLSLGFGQQNDTPRN
jgi:hypothetical protein